MTKIFDTAHANVLHLVERFAAHAARYQQASYQEAEVRKDFIDPFWKALGWDVDHEREHNPYEQEVKVERGVTVARSQKRADYAFFMTPNFRDVRFFVEAKKPSVDLARSVDAHFQIIRYGYSANTPLAVLTDFQHIRVLDCRLRPHPETSLDQVYKSWDYGDFRDTQLFREFYWLFSREAHLDGSYLRRIEELPKHRASAKNRGLFKSSNLPVDASFLAELEDHRETLAKAFKRAETTLDSEMLTEMVQRTLDRLVFLRFLEDKQIETEISLNDFGKGKGAWADFLAASRRLDAIYNGIVFKHLDPLDNVSFLVEDAVFGDVCARLASENSSFNFDGIPIHILGSIYERFLGSVIRATPHRVFVEEKPEVRKAGGVYYTPEYIVRYIVERTVGKIIDGKSPVEIAKLRFADIACGSGSFLLGVYDKLLRYHAEWYNRPENSKQAKKEGCVPTEENRWRLSLAQRRTILQNNIYGVDLDPQAVEVAQLSLFLKLLEDERATSARQYQLDYARDKNLKKLLPDLGKNIVCGNSLIGWDIAGTITLDVKEKKRINPLDFDDAFRSPTGKTTFDVIVGNPPYGAEFDDLAKKYLLDRFKAQNYQPESYLLFLEFSLQCVTNGGYIGMIIPNAWLTNVKQANMRKHISSNSRIVEIVHFLFPVFQKQTVDTEVIILEKADPAGWKTKATIVKSITAFGEFGESHKSQILHSQDEWRESPKDSMNIFLNPQEKALAKKVLLAGPPMEDYFEINVGIKPYQTGKGVPKQTKEIVESRPFDSASKSSASHRVCLRGADISRYLIAPVATRYLKFGIWLAEPRPSANFDAPQKIFIRQTGDSLVCALDDQKRICLNNMHVLVPKTPGAQVRYFLGLVNSKLLNWYYQTLNPEQGEALAEVKKTNVARLPMRTIDFHNKQDKIHHDRIVSLVDKMLIAKSQAVAGDSQSKEIATRECAALDRQIDVIVYELYGLSASEIALVQH